MQEAEAIAEEIAAISGRIAEIRSLSSQGISLRLQGAGPLTPRPTITGSSRAGCYLAISRISICECVTNAPSSK